MYQRPCLASSSSSDAANTASTGTHASSSTPAGWGGVRRSSRRLGGHASWQSSHPYSRSPSASRNSSGKSPGACSRWARQRRGSGTPGGTSAPGGEGGREGGGGAPPPGTGVAAPGAAGG